MFDVTPYYLLRSAVDGGDEWNYWDVGVQRAWALCEGLTFTARFYGELGDGRLFESQYGANPHHTGGSYADGMTSLNLVLRLDYALTDWCSLFAFVHQFDVVIDIAKRRVWRIPGLFNSRSMIRLASGELLITYEHGFARVRLGDGETGEVLQTFLQPSGRNLFEVVWHLDDWEMFGSLSGIDVLESP